MLNPARSSDENGSVATDSDALATDAAVEVTSVSVNGNHLESTIEYRRDLRSFFDESPFFVEYDVDISSVPEAILTVPVLAQVCPVAWAVGADVRVSVVDRRFLNSLATVGNVLCEMYPSFMEGGRVIAGEAPIVDTVGDVPDDNAATPAQVTESDSAIEGSSTTGKGPSTAGGAVSRVEGVARETGPGMPTFGASADGASGSGASPHDGNENDGSGSAADGPAEVGKAGMLFTGGVDSLATYLRHSEEEPTLINVHGWAIDVDDDRRWAHTKRRIGDYADRFDTDARFVRSNMLEFLDTTMLNATYKPHHDGSWYSAVGSGLGLTGLVAPLTVATGMERLYVAASHWDGFSAPDGHAHWDGGAMPWGSDPAIDDEVAWASTEVVHDAFDLTRQERIGVVADFAREHDPSLPVRACEASDTGDNCNDCEKCVRTAFGLAVAGVDPNDHGFDVDAETFERARSQFESGNWLLDHHHLVYWQAFQRRVDPDAIYPVEGAEEFAEWLRAVDVEAFADRSAPPALDRFLRAAARNTPYAVYDQLYPVYDSLTGYLDDR